MQKLQQPPPGISVPTWIVRAGFALTIATLAVIVVFFAAFALIAATIFAIIVGIRLWWVLRRIRAMREVEVIEGSYSIEPDLSLTEQFIKAPITQRSDSTYRNAQDSSCVPRLKKML